MFKYIISLIFMTLLAGLIYITYQHFFKRNVQRALRNKDLYKLPDLNDLVSFYLFFCAIVFFGLLMNDAATSYDKKAGHCIVDNVSIENINHDYGFCINTYNNIIFINQDKAMDEILKQNSALIEEIMEKRNIRYHESYDNLYYALQQYQNSDEETALYQLLDIYRNYYLTEEKGGVNS